MRQSVGLAASGKALCEAFTPAFAFQNLPGGGSARELDTAAGEGWGHMWLEQQPVDAGRGAGTEWGEMRRACTCGGARWGDELPAEAEAAGAERSGGRICWTYDLNWVHRYDMAIFLKFVYNTKFH